MDTVKADEFAPDWIAIRADYEAGGRTLDDICARYGVTRSALSWRVKHQLWSRRNVTSSVGRPLIIARMFRLLEKQIIQLEQDMTQTGEKEVAVLGKLASTLEKLIDIDRAAAPQKAATQVDDIKEIRAKLALRIAQLKGV